MDVELPAGGVFGFQSTLSVRRATAAASGPVGWFDISIHALREESDLPTPSPNRRPEIFQSTLSVRRATPEFVRLVISRLFQSTLSVRRATEVTDEERRAALISIHALREESDYGYLSDDPLKNDFNPRSP